MKCRVSKQEVPCGMRDDFLKFVVLPACQLCTVAILYVAYRDRRFYTTGSYLRPVYLQVIPVFMLHSRICSLFRSLAQVQGTAVECYNYWLKVVLINLVEH